MGCLFGPGFDPRQLHKTVWSLSFEQERISKLQTVLSLSIHTYVILSYEQERKTIIRY